MRIIIGILLAGLVALLFIQPNTTSTPESNPGNDNRRRPLLPRLRPEVGAIRLDDGVGPDGKEVQVDVPLSERIRNIGSRVDGFGMCVMSSIEMAARWANLEQLRGLRDWCARQPGGAYPAKVTRQLNEYCREKGIPVPGHIQYEGDDETILELALRTGRPVGVTYNGRDGVRYRGYIAHMVLLVHMDESTVVLLDNNGIGENELLWMNRAEFRERWLSRDPNTGRLVGWAFVWLAPPPPPIPCNHDSTYFHLLSNLHPHLF